MINITYAIGVKKIHAGLRIAQIQHKEILLHHLINHIGALPLIITCSDHCGNGTMDERSLGKTKTSENCTKMRNLLCSIGTRNLFIRTQMTHLLDEAQYVQNTSRASGQEHPSIEAG